MSVLHTYHPPYFGDDERGSMSTVREQALQIVEALGYLPWGDHEGFRGFKFGTRAGPHHTVDNLLHEIAHCIQLKDDELHRVDEHGWGFGLRTVRVGHQDYVDVTTTQCTEREAETHAIQVILVNRIFGVDIEEAIADYVSVHRFLPDYILIPTERGETVKETEARRNAWIADRIRHYMTLWDWNKALDRYHHNLGVVRDRHASVLSA